LVVTESTGRRFGYSVLRSPLYALAVVPLTMLGALSSEVLHSLTLEKPDTGAGPQGRKPTRTLQQSHAIRRKAQQLACFGRE